jgi:predicted PurR-regulated permease PerM
MGKQEETTYFTTERGAGDKDYVSRAVEASIHIGLVVLLALACFVVLRPFLPLLAWGIVIAIAAHPYHCKLQHALSGRGGLSAVLITFSLLAVLIVPTVLFAKTAIEGTHALAEHLKGGSLVIPPPPARIESWPVIGVPLKNAWTTVSTNIVSGLRAFAPQIRTLVSGLLSASAGMGLLILQFALSIVVAGVVLAKSHDASQAAHALARRTFGEKAAEFEQVAASTVRSVTTGILGVAVIQAVLAGVAFLVAGLPGAGLWTIVFLVAAVLQVGTLVLIPAVIYVFVTSSVTKALIFLAWCLIVALVDNILKPILLGRGVAVPIAVVFLGAIGGFLAMGILGLFVGAIVLCVGYKLFLAWLDRVPMANQEGTHPVQSC